MALIGAVIRNEYVRTAPLGPMTRLLGDTAAPIRVGCWGQAERAPGFLNLVSIALAAPFESRAQDVNTFAVWQRTADDETGKENRPATRRAP